MSRRVYHPTLRGVSYEVADGDRWKAAGWRFTPPGEPTSAPVAPSEPVVESQSD